MDLYIVIVLATLVVVGIVVWIRPSPRDKKLAKWRRDAIVAGLKVKLEGFNAEPKVSGIREDIEGISYQLLNTEPDKRDVVQWAVVARDGWLKAGLPEGWSWYQKEAHTTIALKIHHLICDSPLPIVGIERTPYMSRIVWNESGKEFDANELRTFLKAVQEVK